MMMGMVIVLLGMTTIILAGIAIWAMAEGDKQRQLVVRRENSIRYYQAGLKAARDRIDKGEKAHRAGQSMLKANLALSLQSLHRTSMESFDSIIHELEGLMACRGIEIDPDEDDEK